MKKDWKYILYLSLIVGLFATIRLLSPKQYDWSVTLSHEDKNPFGTYALNTLLSSLTKAHVKNTYKTVYELKDSLTAQETILIIATGFNAAKEDTEVLLEKINNGATAFISANYFSGALADSLGIATYDNLFKDKELFTREDTATLHLTNLHFDSTEVFPFLRDNIHNYFGQIDSVKALVAARNEIGQPVTVVIKHGKGNLILNSTPMVFTNIHLLSKKNHQFAAGLLSYLPTDKTIWRTEFYHVGRMEAGSPLRFILNNEPLRWAYYLALASLLVFMVFEAKRKQRIIPIIRPLANSTLEFVATIGNLYYQKGDHKNMAEKKISFFLEQVRTQFYLNTFDRDHRFIETLSKKSGHDHQETVALIQLIKTIGQKNKIGADELKELNLRIEKFWTK